MSESFHASTIESLYVKNDKVYSALTGEEAPLATLHDPEFSRLLEDLLLTMDNIINAPFEPIMNEHGQYMTQGDWDDLETELNDKEFQIREFEDQIYDLQSDIERLEITEEQNNELTGNQASRR